MNIYCIHPKGYNIGNKVIFLSMQYFIKQAFGYMPNIITLPATSKYDNGRAGLTSRTIHEINQFGNGIIIGGGNLYENNELDVDLDALEKLEVPLFLFSLSRGKVYNKEGKLKERTDTMPFKKIEALNNKAILSNVRDKATQEYLGDETVLSACPSLFLNKVKYILPEVKKDLLLISIRNPDLMNIPVNKRINIIDTIKTLLSYYKGDVRLLCHDWRDIPFVESFNFSYIYTENVYEFLSILQNCKLNISFRLHSTLPCLSYNKPVINISYDERGSSLLETIGYKEWDINLMETISITEEISNRYYNLGDLNVLKNQNEDLWEEFYNTILNLFLTFAKELK